MQRVTQTALKDRKKLIAKETRLNDILATLLE